MSLHVTWICTWSDFYDGAFVLDTQALVNDSTRPESQRARRLFITGPECIHDRYDKGGGGGEGGCRGRQQRGAGYKLMDEDTPPAEPGFEGPRATTTDHGNTVVRSASEYLPNLPASTVSALVDEPSPTGNGEGVAAPASSRLNKASVDAQGRILNPRSCVTCRKRKVKCDKIHPSCSNCNRAHIECVFPAPGRAPRKARKLGDGRDKELLERLRRLEGVVKGLGVDVPVGNNEAPDIREDQPAESQVDRVVREEIADDEALDAEGYAPKPHANGVSDTSPELDRLEQNDFQAKTRYVEEQQSGRFDNGFGRLVINDGRSRYINNSFWASLSNEVEDLKGIFNQSSDEEDDAETGADPLVTNHQGWVFGFSSQNVDMLALHPIPGQIALYWDIFKDRVDPLVKVLHVPTVETAVLNSATHLSTLSRGFEALLFAIYYGAVTSLTAEDCRAKLDEDKQILLSRYRFAFEQSLARANFLTTEEIVVLQAFVIFLICLRRNHDARVIWTLTGLVVRISQTLGIHRDGLHFAGGLSPFEIEMRRRLWWQICTLDIRASEDHGCDPTITEQLFDTRVPLNINDEDIGPSSPDFPPERQGCTGISFCLIRFEVANTFRRINYVPPGTAPRTSHGNKSGNSPTITLADKEKWIAECHQRLEERYLKHCDMSVPLFWVTATVARLMMSKMWLMVYHPFQRQDGGASLPIETKDKLFITSLENIEYSLLLETEARTMKWGWLFRTYMQWHALDFMLSELCHRSTGDLVKRAWVAVEKTRDGRWGRPLGADARAGHLWRPLRKLYRKAREARQRGMAEERLEKQQGLAPPLSATRTYTPNANPMFGQPKRPQVTRAPLSQAQVLRFSQGPSYGDMPMDKHEWLRSPKPPSVGQDDVEGMDTADLNYATMTTNSRPAISGSQRPTSNGTFSAPLHAPKATTRAPLEQPGLTNNWMNNGTQYGQHASNGGVDYKTDQSGNAASSAMDLSGTAGPDLRLPDQMGAMDTTGFDFDPGIMDTTGEVNWQNWDELVRQFGMDVDTTFDRRPSDVGFDGLPDDGSTMAPNPAQANLRMGMGMGMGGGDWF
ncbi:hypothetical protein LTR82_015909 [Friedmanniomyces endolithicus]|uniref:Zn(2)-C6 fungal-type domain-containing protein n=1 Tax=Friedmanniomyces endolithicus TaxID=329885 RepID=A0AAN6FAW7_9PEZI|nr:hypothetical protein LTR82_015909 [Friedmanniomyces endolithicus]